MSQWPATKARRVLAALERIGWRVVRTSGSHRTLRREGWPQYRFAWHDKEEIGPVMLAEIAKHTGLVPEDLWGLPGSAGAPQGAVRGNSGRDASLVKVVWGAGVLRDAMGR